MTQQIPTYKVFNRTFLSSVRWLFGYSAKGEHFVDAFKEQMLSVGYEAGESDGKAVIMKKSGIGVLANNNLIFINCSPETYKGFDNLKLELKAILGVLDSLGIHELNSITCSKENLYKVEKALLKKSITEQIFTSILFKGDLLNKSMIAETRDGVNCLTTRSYSETLNEVKMQLLVTVLCMSKIPLSAVYEQMTMMDRLSFEVWSSYVSDAIIKIMES